jgi:hypothetical protein
MKRWLSGNLKHIVVWGVLVIYLLSANQLYVQFILKNGKPVATNLDLPPVSSNGIVYRLSDFVQPLRYEGQDQLQLKGYAFTAANPTALNKITVILISSEGQTIAFPTMANPFPNMIESYKGYVKGMEHAEFSVLLSKNALKPGTYKIGILLEDSGGASRSYVLTGSRIQKTPNIVHYFYGS